MNRAEPLHLVCRDATSSQPACRSNRQRCYLSAAVLAYTANHCVAKSLLLLALSLLLATSLQDAVNAGHLKSVTYQRLLLAVLVKDVMYLAAFALVSYCQLACCAASNLTDRHRGWPMI